VTAFDYAFLGLLCLSVLLGIWRGLVSEIFSLLGWIVAVAVSWQMADAVSPLVAGFVKLKWLHWPIAFVMVFVLLLIVLAVVRLALRGLLAVSGMSPVDRVLGGFFGAVRALIVAVLFVAAAGMTHLPKETWWRESSFAPPLETVVIAVKPWLPKELGQHIKY
jgi:membrane protein required for colicin V production